MKKAAKQKSTRSKQNEGSSPQAPLPAGEPDAKGSPLRPIDFPTHAETAHIAAILAIGGAPDTDEAANRLASAALRLWVAARDEINAQRARASKYWEAIDEAHAGIREGLVRVKARLAALGFPDFEAREHISWNEAAGMLWKDSGTAERDERLENIVAQRMAGRKAWLDWEVPDFRENGFSHLGFIALVQAYDMLENEFEARNRSEHMKSVRAGGTNAKSNEKKVSG